MDACDTTIFISYARQDTAVVKDLYALLQRSGFQPWMDIEDILPGQDWKRRIETAIRAAPIFLACISRNSLNRRGMIQVELREAIEMWQQMLVDDIYLIPVRLEDCAIPEVLSAFHWVDLFQADGPASLLSAIRHQAKRLGLLQKLSLRSEPCDLNSDEAKRMLAERGFFDAHNNWNGPGVRHQYELLKRGNDAAVLDHVTSLLWQQAGSTKDLLHHEAAKYIAQINEKRFFQIDRWRLPTLEEAMSLMEPKKSEIGVHVGAVFDPTQSRIWTADGYDSMCWVVQYFSAFCAVAPFNLKPYDEYVRAVCTWPDE